MKLLIKYIQLNKHTKERQGDYLLTFFIGLQDGKLNLHISLLWFPCVKFEIGLLFSRVCCDNLKNPYEDCWELLGWILNSPKMIVKISYDEC